MHVDALIYCAGVGSHKGLRELDTAPLQEPELEELPAHLPAVRDAPPLQHPVRHASSICTPVSIPTRDLTRELDSLSHFSHRCSRSESLVLHSASVHSL